MYHQRNHSKHISGRTKAEGSNCPAAEGDAGQMLPHF